MNRKNLTSAVIAGLAGAAGIAATAQAVNINPDGLGQVLIYPYYTTRAGNQTLVSVVNTTDNAKAVKVRFLEGKNTREVLDFNLYLSAYDVWTAALLDGGLVDVNCEVDNGNNFGNPDGGQCGVPHLLTQDASCTVPYLFKRASTLPGLQTFLPFKLNDGGGTDIDRTAEGHFEMIEMGTLVGSSAAAATHGTNGLPADCDQLVEAWTEGGTAPGGAPTPDGYWLVDSTVDIEPPSGGLFGGAGIINVANGYMFSYDATAINNYQDDSPVIPGIYQLHAVPGSVEPGLNSGNVFDATVFLDDGTTAPSAGLTRGVDAISYVFMHDQLMNEYSIEADINGETEWVITFPTKSFYVFSEDSGSDTAIPPFTEEWDETTGTACEPVLLTNVYDREERTSIVPGRPGEGPIVSPPPPDDPPTPFVPFELCYETNVIQFVAFGETDEDQDNTPILGALNSTTFELPAGFQNGWAILELDDYATSTGPESRIPLGGPVSGNLEGLPVIGFSASKYENKNAQPGIQAFYGGIFSHKGTRKASS